MADQDILIDDVGEVEVVEFADVDPIKECALSRAIDVVSLCGVSDVQHATSEAIRVARVFEAYLREVG